MVEHPRAGPGAEAPAGRDGEEVALVPSSSDDEDGDVAPRSVIAPGSAVVHASPPGGAGAAEGPEGRGSASALPVELSTPAWAIALAWFVLAGTAAIGIVCTTVFEHWYGLTSFGYAAVDQVLLPFTTLPVTLLAVKLSWLADLLGEPAEGRDATCRASLARSWAEADLLTLVPFRATMFGREFLFFWLVTAFKDLTITYLEMTIVRVVMCWVASLVVCTWLRQWSGISASEASDSLRPTTLTMRVVGTIVLVLSYLRLQGAI